MPLPLLGGILGSVVIGALFAGADTAVTTLPAARIAALVDQSTGRKRRAYERVARDDVKLHSRYLLGRVVSCAVTALCFFRLFEPLQPDLAVALALLSTLVLTGTLLELSTTLGRRYADEVAALAAEWLRPLELLTLPVAAPLGWLGERLAKAVGPKPPDPRVTEVEVEMMVEEGERSGLFGPEPAEMIRNVLDFAERTARDVMVPRRNVEAIEVGTPLEQVVKIITETGHSRYPVYRDQLDNVLGLLYAKDFFRVVEERGLKKMLLKEIVRSPANFVAESQALSTLLRDMRGKRQHLAVVVDEFGGLSGIVTLEDVLEEIVGDIRDEHDELGIQELADGRLVADADVSVSDLSAYLGADLGSDFGADGKDDSLGGLLMQQLGKVPEVGTAVSAFGLRFIVRDSDEHHIGKVEIVRPRLASIP